MIQGQWVSLVMVVVAVGLLLFARLHDPAGWRRAWAIAWGNTCTVVGYGVEWIRWRAVPAVTRKLRVRLGRRAVLRQEMR